MQMTLGFGASQDIEWLRGRLKSRFGDVGPALLRTPIGQLVKSSISSRTRDEVSLGAYHRLVDAYADWSDIAHAATVDIKAVIGEVTYPDVKARYLREALRIIAACRPDFDLAFLGTQSVATALEWLERLPGVGRKVSASTLSFSTLHMPAFVVDTHILRVLRRFGSFEKGPTREPPMTRRWRLCVNGAYCHACPISRRCHAFETQSCSPAAAEMP